VVERIPDFRGRPVGNVILRGRHEALPAHEPLTAGRHADARTTAYIEAYNRAEACDPTALSSFAALLGQDSGDGLVSFHLKRLLAGASGVSVALE
jgi:adenylate cyclase